MKKIIIEFLILLCFSLFVIFFQFNQVPKKLSWDEVEFTRLALSLNDKSYTPYTQIATGHSTLYFYILLASFKIFGINNFALRFPSAIFGVINVLIFYFIARQVTTHLKYFKESFFDEKLPVIGIPFKSILPFLLSLIFITLRWYFNFARFSFEATFLLFLELTSTYFFLKFASSSFWQPRRNVGGVQNRSSEQRFRTSYNPEHGQSRDRNDKVILLIFSAIFSGLSFHSYYPGRIFFLLPLIFLFFYSAKKYLKKNIFIFLFTFLLVISPLLIYLVTHQDLRLQEQLFLADKKLNAQQKISYLGENVLRLTLMFNLDGDLNGRHNYPGKAAFNPFFGAFFLFGFLVTVLNLKNFYNQFFLVYFCLSLLPAIFTYPVENPNSLRTFTAIPSVIYFVGSGIVYLLQSEKKSKILYIIVILALVSLFSLSSLYDFRTYFLYQKQVFTKAFELNGTIQRILNLKLWEKSQLL